MENLRNILLDDIVFIDIETVSAHEKFNDLSEDWKDLWSKKAKSLIKGEESAESVYGRSAIYAEFGKIICIGIGVFRGKDMFRVKSIQNDNERALLVEFCDLMNKSFNGIPSLLCAHNGKEFDFPYIARRILVNGLTLPKLFDLAGKKPWEVPHLDTMELWKFGDFKSFTSLNLMAHLFGIPTPKDDIDGSMVGDVYWKENNLNRIATYCRKDVITLARLFLKFRGDGDLPDEHIHIAD
jgi:DNA polymerase elongation subunit (family B)